MNFNFGEVLTKAWKITWKHKALWGAAIVMTFVIYLIFPLMFVPWFMILSEGDPTRWFDNLLPWILLGTGFFLMMVISYGFMPLIRSALIVGALKAERGAEKISFREIFSDGRAFYLRLLGVMLLYALATMLVSLLFSAIQIFGTVVTMGLASLCLTPLSFLMYPFMFAAMAWMELAESAVVADGLGVMDAIRRGWDTMRVNKMNVFIVALIVYVGIGMVTMLVMVPFFLPVFFAPVFFIEGGEIWNGLLWGAGIWMALFIPIMTFVQGIGMVFMKTTWLLTYLRLTHKPEEIVVLPEANA
ncbi:MAG: hypothetical protein C4583_16745 [Anaerolineaceae bacterium]|nr:MAG: hypothetical protein C4583_16745 [Anaerolineaceae bacterium]